MKCVSKYRLALASLAATAMMGSMVHAALITAGDLVVLQVGDGTTALGSGAALGVLKEYSTSGTAGQTIALPSNTSSGQNPITFAGSSTSEGFLTLSANGQYLTVGGYNANAGTATVASGAASAINRIVGRIKVSDGTVDTSTGFSDGGSPGNIRSVVSNDGTSFYTTNSSGGLRYISSFGSITTTTQITSSPTNVRVANIAGGQLYISAASGTVQGVATVGSGLPTSSGQTTTPLSGFPTTTGPSSYDYYFADSSTLYVADDRTTASGGIQKWTLSGTTWALAYTLSVGSGLGARGLAGVTKPGLPWLGTLSVMVALTLLRVS